MKEERIEAVRDWPEPQSVRDIQVILDFANFYKRFIKNFSRIAAPLTTMLQTTDKSIGNGFQSTLTNVSEKNQSASNGGGSEDIDGNIKNLSSIVKSARSKKLNITKAKFGADFLTLGAKEAFLHLRKVFTEAPILRHFDLEHYIQIKTDALGYAIGGVLSQMMSDQPFSDYVTHKNLDQIFSKFEIGQ